MNNVLQRSIGDKHVLTRVRRKQRHDLGVCHWKTNQSDEYDHNPDECDHSPDECDHKPDKF